MRQLIAFVQKLEYETRFLYVGINVKIIKTKKLNGFS